MQPHVDTKKCVICLAIRPLAAYNNHKMNRDGLSKECSDCRAQEQRLYRQRKFQSKSKHDDSVLRNVRIHNRLILESLPNVICGFDTETLAEYKITLSPLEGLLKLEVRNMEGVLGGGCIYRPDEIDACLDWLRKESVRLELSPIHIMTSKNVIYYFSAGL